MSCGEGGDIGEVLVGLRGVFYMVLRQLGHLNGPIAQQILHLCLMQFIVVRPDWQSWWCICDSASVGID